MMNCTQTPNISHRRTTIHSQAFHMYQNKLAAFNSHLTLRDPDALES